MLDYFLTLEEIVQIQKKLLTIELFIVLLTQGCKVVCFPKGADNGKEVRKRGLRLLDLCILILRKLITMFLWTILSKLTLYGSVILCVNVLL